MKPILTSIAAAIAMAGLVGVAGCGDDAGDPDGADSTAMHDTSGVDIDSGAGGTEVSANEREYEFDGTAASVSDGMVTIDHEAISDYRPAGSNSYRLADAEMAQYVEKGERMHFTLKVTGDQAVITGMETAEDDDDDSTGAGARGSGDLDTIGSNAGLEKKDSARR